MKANKWAAAAALAVLATASAHAKEGGDQYPNGAENWFAGAVPPPGQYLINYFGYYEGKLKDGDGDKVRLPDGSNPEVSAWFESLRYVYVTEQKLFGADWAWHVIVPIVHQSLDIGPLGGEASVTGLGDVTIDPIILAWHGPEWHFATGLDINLPLGVYDKHDSRKSIGANYWSFEPIFAASYLGASGWEVSAKFMYNIKTENEDTDYQSGDEFHMDYLVGKHVGDWSFGLSGYYLKQVTDDEQYGRTVGDGNRGEVFAIGPSIKYQTKGGTHFIGQWQHESSVENRFQGNKYWFKLIMPL